MPDIDPAALSRSDSIPGAAPTPLTLKVSGTSLPLSQKASKSINAAQRIDIEPLYTGLKAAVGELWGQYKEAVSLFLLGTSSSDIPETPFPSSIMIYLTRICKRPSEPERTLPSHRLFRHYRS